MRLRTTTACKPACTSCSDLTTTNW